jgi:hypothetical protein
MLQEIDENNKLVEGLGVHDFGRVPCSGEYVILKFDEQDNPYENFYQVVNLVHCQYDGSSHSAEIFVVKSKNTFIQAIFR